MNPDCKYISDIDVNNVEKRYNPSKYYVYCIWVTWSDSNKFKIYRRYSQFFDLQCKLLDRFKREAGHYNPHERIIPFLPGKKLFSRSQIQSVALERMYQINAYCKRLIKLKPELSCSDLVLKFFELNQDDLNSLTQNTQQQIPDQISSPKQLHEYICIHDFKALSPSEISLRKNQIVNVLEKNMNGWWFVSMPDGQGYVPQSVLRSLTQVEEQKIVLAEPDEVYIVCQNYQAKKFDEVSIKKGDYIRVNEKRLDGWWTVEYNGLYGLAPAVCLSQINKSKLDKEIDSKSMVSLSSFDSLSVSSTLDEVYYVLEDYDDPMGESLSLKKGQICKVLNMEGTSGWWYVIIESTGNEGWAPCAFLTKEKIKPPRPKPPLPPKPIIKQNETFLTENDKTIDFNKLRNVFEK